MNTALISTLIEQIEAAGIKLSASNDQLIVDAPKGKLTPVLRESLIKNKRELLKAITYYGFTGEELRQQLGEDWEEFKNNQAALVAFAQSLHERKLMKTGNIPDTFTAETYCSGCHKTVRVTPALAGDGHVYGCPWCHIH